MSKPRNPHYFPRMKVRGKGRRMKSRLKWARLSASVSAAVVAFSGMAAAAVKAISQLSEAFARVQAVSDATNKQMAEIALNARSTTESPTEALNAFGQRASRKMVTDD